MERPYTIYGAQGTGSVPVEAALTLVGATYVVREGKPWESKRAAKALARVNPMAQIPTLILPNGEIMTESAAILIWLADTYPDARLAPAPGHARRPAFLRWMNFVSAAIYATFWIGDEPSLLVEGEAAEQYLLDRLTDRLAGCWRKMDRQVEPSPYIVGEEISVLDLYVAVISRWAHKRKRFYREAPRMAEVVRLVDAEPRLDRFWASRFPFVEGWEG
jgi:GST-like protein